MQAGDDAFDARLGQVLAQRNEYGVAAAALAGAHEAEVAVVLATGDEVREHQLRQRRTAQITRMLGCDQVREQVAGRDQPAQAQSRREGLGGTAGVGHVIGRAGLQRRDRRAIVAVLGVVVDLDDQTAGRGPVQQGPTPLRCQDDPGGELVRGGEQRRRQARARQLSHLQPLLVDRDRHRLQIPSG